MRTRILLILGLGILIMLVAMLGATRIILLRGAERAEHTTMAANIQRVHNAMQWDLDSLGQTAVDWASWDETYDFILTLSPTYIENNLAEETLENLDVDVLAYYASDGALRHVTALVSPPEDLRSLLQGYPGLVGPIGPGSPKAGIALLDGGLWIVVARPIYDNEETLPSRGTLVMARVLSVARVELLAQLVLLDLQVVPASGPEAPRLTHGVRGREMLNVERPDLNRLRAYTLLIDVAGKPAASLAVETDSDIREQAFRSTLASVASIIATGILFGAGALLFLERRVLARLHSLGAQVLAIKTGERTAQRLELPGKDQIAYLAAAINGLLGDLEKSAEELRQSERRTLAFLEAVPDLIVLISADGTIRDLRMPDGFPSFSEVGGQTVQDMIRSVPWLDGEVRERLVAAIQKAKDTQQPGFLEAEMVIDGKRRAYEVRVSGSPSGETVVVARDVTAQRNAEAAEQKELLLRETHHRVRNNLQVISSLLALQANAAADPAVRAMLEESQDRVRSMSLIHERLSRAERPGGLGFASYLRDLVEHLERSYGDSGRIRIETVLEDVGLPEDASLPAGLVVTELLTNALRHAYPGGRSGHVVVGLERTNRGAVAIRVQDDGVGLPGWVDPLLPTTLGFRIVRALVDQVGAILDLDRTGGTRFRLTLGGRS